LRGLNQGYFMYKVQGTSQEEWWLKEQL
jgi:hypothetical protein